MEQFRLLSSIVLLAPLPFLEPTEENIVAIRRAIDAEHRSGGGIWDSACISHLAEALLATGDIRGAETALQEGFAYVEQSGERFRFADLHRVDGRVALSRQEPDLERAEACFLRAIDVARAQEAVCSNYVIDGGETTRDVRKVRAFLAESI